MNSRTIAVWCPDWPVTAAGASPADLVAVLTANRVVACSHAARVEGVRRGQRRREAQARCPELVLLARDEAAEARKFEPVVLALESVAPGVEITRPGLAAIGASGATRYFGGEDGVLTALARAVSPLATEVLIGIADGAFAAEQAARRALIVPPGQSAQFLAGLPVSVLDQPPLVDVLRRLGIRTLGDFAALPARDVLARFGPDGAWAHRQAGGREDRPVAARRPPAEFDVVLDLDAAVDRVDTMAFTASAAAERFVADLAGHGLACACFALHFGTDRGEENERRWRHTGVLTASDVVDRLRWQLEGWRSGPRRPTGGIVRLRLTPIETVPIGAHQQALWGGAGVRDEQVSRSLARVQTLLGPGSVRIPAVQGGRTPAQRTRYTAWGDDPAPVRSPDQPWPGRLPAPAPTVLLDPPRVVQVLDAGNTPVRVTDSGAVTCLPSRLVIDGEPAAPITAWAGPWPVDERWWDPDTSSRVALFQLVDARGRAYLASCHLVPGAVRWTLDAIYD